MTKRKQIREIKAALKRKKDALDAAQEILEKLTDQVAALQNELNDLIGKPNQKPKCGYCGQPDGYCGQC